MLRFDTQPRLVRCDGHAGSAWLVACPATHLTCVVDPQEAWTTVLGLVAHHRLRVVALLGTRAKPTPPEGTTFPGAEAIGPVGGWGGALVVGAGERTVEVAPGEAGVLVAGRGDAGRGFQLVVGAIQLRVGQLLVSGWPISSELLGWRVVDHVFVPSSADAPTDGALIHTTTEPFEVPTIGGGDTEVRLARPAEFDLLGDLQILDVEPALSDAPLLPGARRVGQDFSPSDAGLDPRRPVLVVSMRGVACDGPARRLADLGFDVVRLEGGSTKWAREGRPLARAVPADDREELSLDNDPVPVRPGRGGGPSGTA